MGTRRFPRQPALGFPWASTGLDLAQLRILEQIFGFYRSGWSHQPKSSKEAHMDFGSINWLAVLVCLVVSMVVGWFWYGQNTLFPIWWKGIGKTGAPGQGGGNMGLVWGLTVLCSLVPAVFMALLINATGKAMGGPSLVTGLQTGFLVWLGAVAPTNLVNKLFAGYSPTVWLIEAGNHLVNFLLFGAILGAWR